MEFFSRKAFFLFQLQRRVAWVSEILSFWATSENKFWITAIYVKG